MKKLIILLTIISLIIVSAFPAQALTFGQKAMMLIMSGRPGIYRISGLTYFNDFSNNTTQTADADFSKGDRTVTVTASRGASNPATYYDADGVMQVTTTSNVPRITQGYYSESGFTRDPGILVEGQRANLLTYASVPENEAWTKTNITADNDDAGSSSPDGTATAPSLTATADNGTFLLASAATGATYSVFLKRKTGTGAISITANGGTGYTEVTLPASGWGRFSVTASSASQTCGIKIATSGDAVYVFGNQFENATFASSFIPTTTAALTRNAETVKYAISGNRTAAQETIAIKFTPLGGNFANDGTVRDLLTSDTKSVRITKFTTATVLRFFPNHNDTVGCEALGTTNILKNTSYVVAGIAAGATADANAIIYVNGSPEGTDSDNYTTPAWGTYFYLGSSSAGAQQLFGIISKAAFFNRALSVTEVGRVTTLMNQQTYASAPEGGGESGGESGSEYTLLLEDGTSWLLESGDEWLLEN